MLLLILLIVIIIIIIIIIIIRALGIYKRVNICNNFSIVGDLYCKMFLTFFYDPSSDFFCQITYVKLQLELSFLGVKGSTVILRARTS